MIDGPVRITLSCPTDVDYRPAEARLFYGPYQGFKGRDSECGRYRITQNPTTLQLTPSSRLHELRDDYQRTDYFAPQVLRLMLPLLHGPVTLHGVEPEPGTTVRPPRADELPQRTMLSYGTSITQGSGASGPHLNYIQQCARALHVDSLNLGFGGSAHCETVMADYLAQRDDWHLATLCLSVNMLGFPESEYAARLRYMVHTVAGRKPNRPVFAITLFPYSADVVNDHSGHADKARRYREHLRRAVADCPTPNVHLVEGPDLLRDIIGHSEDLLHPGDFGMMQMGLRLAEFIRPVLDKQT